MKGTRDFDWVDRMPPAVRAVVHDHGLAPVRKLMDLGVRDAGAIRDAIFCIRIGAREHGNKPRNHIEALMDDVLRGYGVPPIARDLVATLRQSGLTILPVSPSQRSVETSMRALEGHGLVSKQKKHRIRLSAALRDADDCLWGPRS